MTLNGNEDIKVIWLFSRLNNLHMPGEKGRYCFTCPNKRNRPLHSKVPSITKLQSSQVEGYVWASVKSPILLKSYMQLCAFFWENIHSFHQCSKICYFHWQSYLILRKNYELRLTSVNMGKSIILDNRLILIKNYKLPLTNVNMRKSIIPSIYYSSVATASVHWYKNY